MKKFLPLLALFCASALFAQPPASSPRPVTVDPSTGNIGPSSVNGHVLNLPIGTTVNGTAIGGGSGLTGGTSGHVITASGATTIQDSGTALTSLQTTSGTLALGTFGSITGRIGNVNLPLGAQLYTSGSVLALDLSQSDTLIELFGGAASITSAGNISGSFTGDGSEIENLYGVNLAANQSVRRNSGGITYEAFRAQEYDTDLTTWAGITPGTGVGTALALNVGSAGAFVTFNGVGGTPSSLVLTNATGSPTGISLTKAQLNTIVSDDDPAYLGAANTFTASQANSYSGTASTPAMKYSGVPFAGTGTNSFPLVYINDANATASTTLNTNGTYLGVNGDGSQDLMNLLKDGTSQFKVSSGGNVSASNNIVAASGVVTAGSGQINMGSGNLFYGAVIGVLRIAPQGGAAPIRLDFGDDTNSWPALGSDAVNGFTVKSAAGTTTWNDSSTATSGTVANRYLFGIAAPTLTATNSSVSDTVASTVYIGGAPTASTNTTIGTAWALNVAAGNVNVGGKLVVATQTPSSASDTGIAGQIAWDSSYIYICTATNTWKRVAIASW